MGMGERGFVCGSHSPNSAAMSDFSGMGWFESYSDLMCMSMVGMKDMIQEWLSPISEEKGRGNGGGYGRDCV